MKRNTFTSALLALLFFSACDKEPDLLINEEIYKKLFIEITMVNHIDERSLHETDRDELRDRIFIHYNVTEEMFRFSHNHYESDIEAQLKRLDEISLILRSERDKIIELERLFEAENRESLDSLRQRILNR